MSQLFDFDSHIQQTIENYQGDAVILGNALGALVLGRYVGWRVLRIVYSSPTYSKYQKILGVNFKDVLRERDFLSKKSLGLAIIDRLGGFWDFVRQAAGPSELKVSHNIFQ